MKIRLLSLLFFASNLLRSQDSFVFPVYFQYKSYVLDSFEERSLEHFIHKTKRLNVQRIKIDAYCDDRGSRVLNDSLSEKRSRTISQFLLSRFSKSIPISPYYHGSVPLIQNNSHLKEEIRSKNRRAEVRIYYSRQTVRTQAGKSMVEQEDLASKFKKAKVGDKLRLKIFFQTNTHRFNSTSFPELDTLVGLMRMDTSRKISIQGYISSKGKYSEQDKLNKLTDSMNLSETRARAVYYYLVKQGIEPYRLQYRGMAGRFPTGKAHFEDRRVEIELIE